jgi:hypothetical protein
MILVSRIAQIKNMIIQKDGKEIIITLSQAFDSRLKMLNLFYALLFFFGGLFFMFSGFHASSNNTGSTIFITVFTIAFYIASFRFFNKAVLFEKLQISNLEVRWMEKSLFKSKAISFDIKEISNFRFIEKGTIAPHPLAGQSMDYLGFETQEKLIGQLGGDKQIAFDYKGKTISFGADLYSYEFDEIKSVFDKEAGKIK